MTERGERLQNEVGGGDVEPGVRAPAKVNLFFRVLAREEDGYHQIETLFQKLELADTLHVALEGEPGVQLELEGVAQNSLGPTEENLAVRAARIYLDHPKVEAGSSGVGILLRKNIPHGAGLGGGSSDAAAVLRELDRLMGDRLGTRELVRLGSRLGADVPFFVLGASRALAWGRGDRLFPLPPLSPRNVVLALPPVRVPTPRAYARLVEHRRSEEAGVADGRIIDPEELSDWAGIAKVAENAFEAALEDAHPEFARLRGQLRDAGARPALLSGSGSAVAGFFESREKALTAAHLIEEAGSGTRAIVTRTSVGPSDPLVSASGRWSRVPR